MAKRKGKKPTDNYFPIPKNGCKRRVKIHAPFYKMAGTIAIGMLAGLFAFRFIETELSKRAKINANEVLKKMNEILNNRKPKGPSKPDKV